jgi:hypothetical protein
MFDRRHRLTGLMWFGTGLRATSAEALERDTHFNVSPRLVEIDRAADAASLHVMLSPELEA